MRGIILIKCLNIVVHCHLPPFFTLKLSTALLTVDYMITMWINPNVALIYSISDMFITHAVTH